MRTTIALLALLVTSLTVWPEELTYDQLFDAVDSENTAVISGWLTPERIASEHDRGQIADVLVRAIEERKARVVTQMLQAQLSLFALESDALDQAVVDVSAADDEGILGVLELNGWSPQLAFAAYQAEQTSAEEQGNVLERGQVGHMFMPRLIEASLEKNIRFLRLCLDTGLSPDYELLSGVSLINQTIRQSAFAAFKMLIEHGASLTEVRGIDQFKTTLASAIELQGEKSPFVAILKAKGAYTLHYTHPKPNIAQSTTDRLRIRTTPGLDGSVIGYLMTGDVVQLLEVTPLASQIDGMTAPWIRIRRAQTEGWVFGGYLDSSQPDGQS